MTELHTTVILILAGLVMIPVVFYTAAKMAAYGWYRGKQLFERDNKIKGAENATATKTEA